ncbi:type 2 lanthipeptide synthetase LanM [Streptomyces ovatisporus]|uniref:Type 2 lanthipeptide synthetase LanM n=1 Tax=Streptomyces ovatisporus TaxID=1128682 RepID=A0ABV9A071_9ACTN
MSEPDVSIPAFLPFYAHLAPRRAVEDALRGLAAPVTAPERLEEVLDQAWSGVLTAIEGQSFRSLIGEFHAFRESRGLPMDAGGDEALQQFRAHLGSDDNCRGLIGKYPVLQQRLATILRNLLEAYADLFAAYTADRTELKAAGLIPAGDAEALIEKVLLTGSDPHNDNRQVIQLRLTGGTRLVFKPRALVSDRFVKDLYDAADPYLQHSLRECIPLSVSTGTHGWQQFVASAPMESPDQPARYFYRFGALCAVFGTLGASDLHDENLLACGETPSVIDTETMLRADAGVENDSLPHVLVNHMKLSVVSTMLVPVVNPTSPIDVVMAGVGVAGDQKSKLKRAAVRDGTTDSISVTWEPVTYKHHGNVPRLGDERLSAPDYFSDILAGYSDGLEFVRSDGILKVIDAYPDMPVRSLMRSTMVYGRFLDASTHPDYLRESDEAARLFGLLARMPDYLSPEAADYVAEEERTSLSTGNVPYFMTRADSTELATLRTRFPGVYRTSPLDMARRGVAMNSGQSDRYHHFLLEECFSEVVGADRPEGLSSESLFGGTMLDRARPGTWWPEIARRIDEIGVQFETPEGTETGWVCGIGPERNVSTITPGNFVSFHDSGGIVTFLGRAARHDSALRSVHAGADRGLRSLLSKYGDLLMQTPESVFTGAASMLLTRPADVDREWLAKIFESIDERALSNELENDLANGPAGLLMVLLSRMEESGESVLCGEEHLAKLRDLTLGHLSEDRTAKWFDVAHGELGLRWACSRMGRVLGDAALVEQSADWLVDRSSSDEETPYTGWCNGAAGQLLTSAEILSAADRTEWLAGARMQTLVDKATALPDDRAFDLSVCHGSSGVIQSLVATGRLLGEESLITRAHEYQELVLDRIRRTGFYTGAGGRTSLLGYMFGWSGIGDTDVILQSAGKSSGNGVGDSHLPVALSSGVLDRRTAAGGSQ